MATQVLGYSSWTDSDWSELVARCRAAGVGLKDDEVREAAWGYMHHGPDGGGNKFGPRGQVVAMEVDRLQRGRCGS